MWAYSNNATLLAANANQPSIGGSGSGIYNGRAGILIAVVSEVPITKVLKAKIPIDTIQPGSHEEPVNNLIESYPIAFEPNLNLKKENLSNYNVYMIDFDKNTTQIGEICQNQICCRYNIKVSDNGERPATVIIIPN